MGRYSVAYSSFIRRLDEIEAILAIARELPRPFSAPNSPRVNALCRGGIVLLSSHIEGYVEELGSLAVDRLARDNVSKAAMPLAFRYHLSQDLIDDIREARDPTVIATKIVEFWTRDGHIWDNTPQFGVPLSIDAVLSKFATPRHENIRKFFRRFGYDNLDSQLRNRLRQDFVICKNMVDHVVDERNKIAHGDFVTAGTPQDLHDMSRLVKVYCRNLDHVVGDWFKSRGCPVR